MKDLWGTKQIKVSMCYFKQNTNIAVTAKVAWSSVNNVLDAAKSRPATSMDAYIRTHAHVHAPKQKHTNTYDSLRGPG